MKISFSAPDSRPARHSAGTTVPWIPLRSDLAWPSAARPHQVRQEPVDQVDEPPQHGRLLEQWQDAVLDDGAAFDAAGDCVW